jgi:hypothetical protein
MKQHKIEHADELRFSVNDMAAMLRCSPQWLNELIRRGWIDRGDDGLIGCQQALHAFVDAKSQHRA